MIHRRGTGRPGRGRDRRRPRHRPADRGDPRRHGAQVAVLDLDPTDLDGILGIECDVSDRDAVEAAFAAGRGAARGGVRPRAQRRDLPGRAVRADVAASCGSGRWRSTSPAPSSSRAGALPGMREQGYGRIVGIGASAGKAGGAGSVAAYAASKAGLMTLMKSIANEYARDGITANALAPAFIDTGVLATTREVAAQIPVGRYGTIDEVAAARDLPVLGARRVHHGRGPRHQRRDARRLRRTVSSRVRRPRGRAPTPRG